MSLAATVGTAPVPTSMDGELAVTAALPEPIGLARPRWWNDAMGAVGLAMAPWLWALVPSPRPVLYATVGVALVYLVLWLWFRRCDRGVTAHVVGSDLVVRRRADGAVLERAPLASIAHVEPLVENGRIDLRLLDSRRAVRSVLCFADEAAARAWLAAIPTPTDRAAFPFQVALMGETLSPIQRRVAGVLCVLGSALSIVVGGPPIVYAALMILVQMVFSFDVVADANGIRNGLPWRRRTYRWQDVEAIVSTNDVVTIVTRAGTSHELLLTPGAAGSLLRERAERTLHGMLERHTPGAA